MSWATTRDAIEAVLGTVAGIAGGAGKVLDYRPLIERPDEWRAALKGTTRINAWTVTREAATLRQTGTGRRWVPVHEVYVEGWYAAGVDTATTEAALQGIVDALLAALAASTTIYLVPLEGEAPMVRAVPINHQSIGGVLCHHVETRFAVQDTATVL